MSTSVTDPGAILDAAVNAVNNPGSQESTSIFEEEAAASEEAQAASAEETVEEDVIEDPGAAKPTKGRSPALQKILDEKFGGDEDKFTESLYEQWNSSSRLHKELQDLKNLVVSQQAKATEEELPQLESPDIQAIESELTDLGNDFRSNEVQQADLIKQSVQYNNDIAEAKGELKKADDFEKARLEALIDRLEAKKEQAKEKYQALDKDQKRINREASKLLKDKSRAEKDLEDRRSQLTEDKKAFEAKKAEYVTVYTRVFETEVKPLNIPTEEVAEMYHDVRRQIKEYLESLPEGSPEQDLAALTRAAVAGYAKRHNYQKRAVAADKTKAKLETTSKPAVKSPTPLAAAAKTKEKLPEGWSKMSNEKKARYASERASQILGG